MKNSTHLEAALTAVTTENKENIQEASKRIGLSHATFYRVINGRRPDIETLRTFCTELARTPRQAKEIAEGYLRDEIARIGMTGKIDVTSEKISITNPEDSRLIKRLTAMLIKNEELHSLIKFLIDDCPKSTVTLYENVETGEVLNSLDDTERLKRAKTITGGNSKKKTGAEILAGLRKNPTPPKKRTSKAA